MDDQRAKVRTELEGLRLRQAELEAQLEAMEGRAPAWPPVGYYMSYHVLAGMIMGIFGAAMSLMFNVIGAAMVGKHPLEIIRVYLTFPLGETALNVDDSSTLAIGCFLYIAMGMVVGAALHVVLSKWFAHATIRMRFMVTTSGVLGFWIVNYYVVLSWLQPLLFGGNWILSMIPWWVAGATHLVFGWTMLVLEPWGRFERSWGRGA